MTIFRDMKIHLESLGTKVTPLRQISEPEDASREFRDRMIPPDRFRNLKMHFESLET